MHKEGSLRRIIHGSVFEAEIERYDVLFLDPPFDMWEEVSSKVLSRISKHQTIVCVSNFQNLKHIASALGWPRLELIWAFPNGKWVSHLMPQLCHESIWIYGKTKETYVGAANKNKSTIKTSSIGKWSDGSRVNTKPRKLCQLKSYIEVCRQNSPVGKWIKPVDLVRPIVEITCSKGARVLDAFAGAGGFFSVLREYDISVDAYELDDSLIDHLHTINAQPSLIPTDFIKPEIKDMQ